jgi:FMN phosphatase YigB (HAD superfamily)
VALSAVFFDVGETLVDEERWWRDLAERSGLQPHVVWAALGVTIERSQPDEVAYVGDRVDNDVLPALTAGLRAVHAQRGPWGRLQRTPDGVPAIDSLAELPQALASLA